LADFGAEYLSIKVTYTPATETWELFLRNDGPSAFADPATGTLMSQGTVVDSTSTGTSLPLMGAWWQGSTGGIQPAFFDNTTVTVDEPTAVKLTGFAALQNGDEVLLHWQTGYEARNLGYNIYRERNGRRVSITPSLIAGSALIAGGPTTLRSGFDYTWYDDLKQRDDGRVPGVTYWLEDVDVDAAWAYRAHCGIQKARSRRTACCFAERSNAANAGCGCSLGCLSRGIRGTAPGSRQSAGV